MSIATHFASKESKKKQIETTNDGGDKSDHQQETKKVNLLDLYSFSRHQKFLYLSLILVILQSRKRGSNATTATPKKKAKKNKAIVALESEKTQVLLTF